MNLDKGGAAAVIGTLYNISKLHINRNVIGVVPLAENAIGPESFKPTSVLTPSQNGSALLWKNMVSPWGKDFTPT